MYRLTQVCRDTFDDEELRITPETTPDDVEGWDSVAQVELVMAVEAEFDVSLSLDEVASIASIGDILKVLANHGIAEGA